LCVEQPEEVRGGFKRKAGMLTLYLTELMPEGRGQPVLASCNGRKGMEKWATMVFAPRPETT
jgi:hypothetical protein